LFTGVKEKGNREIENLTASKTCQRFGWRETGKMGNENQISSERPVSVWV
jgi:hypothetical protein